MVSSCKNDLYKMMQYALVYYFDRNPSRSQEEKRIDFSINDFREGMQLLRDMYFSYCKYKEM